MQLLLNFLELTNIFPKLSNLATLFQDNMTCVVVKVLMYPRDDVQYIKFKSYLNDDLQNESSLFKIVLALLAQAKTFMRIDCVVKNLNHSYFPCVLKYILLQRTLLYINKWPDQISNLYWRHCYVNSNWQRTSRSWKRIKNFPSLVNFRYIFSPIKMASQ